MQYFKDRSGGWCALCAPVRRAVGEMPKGTRNASHAEGGQWPPQTLPCLGGSTARPGCPHTHRQSRKLMFPYPLRDTLQCAPQSIFHGQGVSREQFVSSNGRTIQGGDSAPVTWAPGPCGPLGWNLQPSTQQLHDRTCPIQSLRVRGKAPEGWAEGGSWVPG
jgi:hypothetical protein